MGRRKEGGGAGGLGSQIGIRMTESQSRDIAAAAAAEGFSSVSEWIRVTLSRRCRDVLEAVGAQS